MKVMVILVGVLCCMLLFPQVRAHVSSQKTSTLRGRRLPNPEARHHGLRLRHPLLTPEDKKRFKTIHPFLTPEIRRKVKVIPLDRSREIPKERGDRRSRR